MPEFRNDCVPQRCGTQRCCRTLLSATTVYLDAVVLFAMFTTCTRRFTSEVGLLGSLSLVLPYPTVTRSAPGMLNLSTRYRLIESAPRSDRPWFYPSLPPPPACPA